MTEFRKEGKREHWGKAYSLFSHCRHGHVPRWNLYLRKLLQSVDNCNWHYRRTFPSTQPYSAEEATAREQINRTMGSKAAAQEGSFVDDGYFRPSFCFRSPDQRPSLRFQRKRYITVIQNLIGYLESRRKDDYISADDQI